MKDIGANYTTISFVYGTLFMSGYLTYGGAKNFKLRNVFDSQLFIYNFFLLKPVFNIMKDTYSKYCFHTILN